MRPWLITEAEFALKEAKVFQKVLCVALCPALLCQAPRLIKKPAETGWAYTVILQEVQQHMWTAFTQRPSLEARHGSLMAGMTRM